MRAFFAALAVLIAAPAFPQSHEVVAAHELVAANVSSASGVAEHVKAPQFCYHTEDVGIDGQVKWTEDHCNTVLTGGGNDLLDKYFKGSAYTAAWYMALKGTGTIAATDVWTSHAGWTEVTPYTGNRPAITFGTTSARSNTATAVSYSITGTATVAGACVSSSNTGTTGILYSCSDFGTSRSVVSGDTLNVTLTVSD